MNNKSIRIREIAEKDLKWSDNVDLEKKGLEVPCFRTLRKYKYTEFLKPSLDLLHFRELCERKKKVTGEKYIFQRNDVEYTDVFIVVNRNASGKEKRDSSSIYSLGVFELQTGGGYTKYVAYKRSGNAAKKGKHIFIREEFYEEMMRWTWLGHSPKNLKVSLPYVEMKAYEALVSSNIMATVNIHPDEILLLDDKENKFRTRVAMVREEQGEFSLSRCEADVTNMVFDGECLLDNSVFEAAGMDAGMMLLRNFFFKSCGFRTDIQGYYKEVFGETYENAKVKDRYFNEIDVKKIKMIVTTSSFKLFKFRSFFVASDLNCGAEWEILPVNDTLMKEFDESFNEKWQETSAYELWRRKVEENGCVFGVVKNEEAHRGKRKFTYQMLNSMNFSEGDIQKLMAEDVNTYVKLRSEPDFYESYIAGGKEKGEGVEPSYTDRFIVDLAKKNPVFRNTRQYKTKRSNDLKAFKQKLYEGKLSIEADYYTLCSMPWELLKYSLQFQPTSVVWDEELFGPREHEEAFKNPILKKGEVYIAGLPDGMQLTLCRNPHACASNVVCATNRIIPELEKWFHFRRKDGFSNIAVISSWEWDVMEALNGADFDSDEVLGIRNEIVLERALELSQNDRISAVPHADITADKRGVVAMGDYSRQYRIDDTLSGNKIGLISNYTQMLNSYYWDSFREGSRFAARQEELYDDIQILAVLMGLEIDKAKHSYTFEAERVAKGILDKYSEMGEKNRKRRYRPIFMYYIDADRHNEAIQRAEQDLWLACPMDYVAKKLYSLYTSEKELKNLKDTEVLGLEEVFSVDDYKGCDANRVNSVLEKMENCIKTLKNLNMNKANLDWADNMALKTSLLEETYRLMNQNKASLKEMKRILYILLEKDLTERMKRKKTAEAFYECLLVNNREAVAEIAGAEILSVEVSGAEAAGAEEKLNFTQDTIYKASTEFIQRAKRNGEKQQINYAKCNRLFEEFLKIRSSDAKARQLFAAKLKKDKNRMNIAYLLQTISEKQSYPTAKYEKLMSLAILYHVWPELLLKCVKNTKN